jgi:hypothetical protein
VISLRKTRPAPDFTGLRRVTVGNTSHIEPPLYSDWSLLDKLHWWARAAEVDGGIEVAVTESRYSKGNRPQRDYFDVHVSSGSGAYRSVSGPMRFEAAWTYINGLECGARAARGTA